MRQSAFGFPLIGTTIVMIVFGILLGFIRGYYSKRINHPDPFLDLVIMIFLVAVDIAVLGIFGVFSPYMYLTLSNITFLFLSSYFWSFAGVWLGYMVIHPAKPRPPHHFLH